MAKGEIALRNRIRPHHPQIRAFARQQREAERQAEHLFQTLLYLAFRGEIETETDWLSIALRY